MPLACFFTVLSAISLFGIVGLGRYRKGLSSEEVVGVLAN
jgi:hypothetical protein